MLHIKKKGIVLITTLLTVVLVVMMITAVVHSGASSLSLTAGFHHRENALLAAESGVQYAATRLQDNVFWHGDGFTGSSGSSSVFDSNGLRVVEDNGNVIGVITSKTGSVSAFRIKFNYEDGNQEEKDKKLPDRDGLHDPSDAYKINSKFVSVNNLTNPASTLIYRANDNGMKARKKAETYYIPANTACIIVEGLAGTALRDISRPSDITRDVYDKAVKRVVECYLTFSSADEIDGAAYAGGNINATLGRYSDHDHKWHHGVFSVRNKNSHESPYIHSKGDVNFKLPEGSNSWIQFAENNKTIKKNDSNHVTVGSETNTFKIKDDKMKNAGVSKDTDFHRIEWDDIKKASSTDPTLAGGTYVWIKSSNGYELMHSDRVYRIDNTDYQQNGTTAPTDPVSGSDPAKFNISQQYVDDHPEEWKVVSGLPDGMHMDKKNMIIYIDKNIQVPDTNGIAIRTTTEVTKRAFVAITPAANSTKSSIITTTGNIDIEGGLIGSGSLTSEGEITCQGASIMESDPENGVSMYAKGDINLMEITKDTRENGNASEWEIDISQFASENVSEDEDENPEDPDDEEDDGEHTQGSPEGVINYGEPEDITEEEQARRQKAWEDKMSKLAQTADKIHYTDQDITGIIYTWGNFNCNIGNKNTLSVTGTIIAFGADPDNSSAAAGTRKDKDDQGNVRNGNINITAKRVDLTFDSSAYNGIMGVTGGYVVKRKMWTAWQ